MTTTNVMAKIIASSILYGIAFAVIVYLIFLAFLKQDVTKLERRKKAIFIAGFMSLLEIIDRIVRYYCGDYEINIFLVSMLGIFFSYTLISNLNKFLDRNDKK